MPLTTLKLPAEDIIIELYFMYGVICVLAIVLIVFFIKWLTKIMNKRK